VFCASIGAKSFVNTSQCFNSRCRWARRAKAARIKFWRAGTPPAETRLTEVVSPSRQDASTSLRRGILRSLRREFAVDDSMETTGEIGLSASWDYAQLAKTASEHGGPQPYLGLVKDVAKGEGRAQGAAVGAVLTALGMVAGKKVYAHLQEWRARKELAADAERELLRGMQDASDPTEPDPAAIDHESG
jgi:hypothetical protein